MCLRYDNTPNVTFTSLVRLPVFLPFKNVHTNTKPLAASDSSGTSLDTKRLGLISGEGKLPVHVARNAAIQGYDVYAYAVSTENIGTLKHYCHKVTHITPGLLQKNLSRLQQDGIQQVVFAGKVDKWILLRNPRMDSRAIETLASLIRVNDDAIMLRIIEMLEAEGLHVLPQIHFLQDHFLPETRLSLTAPTDREWKDIHYGLGLAKEMGRLDIGQSIVMKDGMVLAVEAIEGTDACIRRAGQLARKKGGVLVKVAKPGQDIRFDVPTVGLRTLKIMRQAGLKVLATEANETLFLEADAMADYADKYQMSIVSVPFSQALSLPATSLCPFPEGAEHRTSQTTSLPSHDPATLLYH